MSELADDLCSANLDVERAAELWPDKIGLSFDESGERLTFAGIERRSNEIGNALRALGVGPGDKVAVMLRNRVEFPLVWLGIAKSGAAMVPFNVFYKSGEPAICWPVQRPRSWSPGTTSCP